MDLSTSLVEVTEGLVSVGHEMCGADEAGRQAGYRKAAHGLMGLKSLNRAIATGLDSKRREIERKKESLDKLHLQLENLLYKRAYLLREIRECRGLTTPALDTVEAETAQRLAVAQFSRQLPQQHQEALDFLDREMQAREAAKAQLEARRQEYLAREEVLDARRKIVDELPVRITNVESAVLKELTPIFAKGDAILSLSGPTAGTAAGAGEESKPMEVTLE